MAPAVLDEAHDLCVRAFGGRFGDDDWDHALGGLHALVRGDGAELYAARGWTLWRGPSSALTPRGVVRTPDEDGAIWAMPAMAGLDPDGELTCDWRSGDLW